MTRFWLPMGRRVLVLIVMLIALVALFPLRLALGILDVDAQGVTARQVSGSVWKGRIADLNVANVALGDVDAALSPVALLIGEARIRVSRADGAGGAGPLTGGFAVSRHSIGVRDLDLTIPTAAALTPLPIASVTTTGLSARFIDDACETATGAVRATLAGSFAGVPLSQGLSGNAQCEGRYLRLPLASQSGQERIDLRIAIDGSYVADLIAVEPVAERVAALAALGFVAVPGGYRLRATGRLR